MAKIALAAGAAVGGFFLFGPAGIMMGLSVGLAVGEALFPPKIPGRMPLQDLQVSSSADGAPICFGYGTGRFAGQVIWSPGIKFYSVGSSSMKGAAPTGKDYYYTASFAAAFGEGPGIIEQIWADSKIIYMGGQNFGAFAPWDPKAAYLPEQLVSYQWQPTPGEDYVTAIFRCVIAHTGISPAGNSLYWTASGYPYWDSTIQYEPGNQVAYPREHGEIYAPTTGQIYTCVNPNINQTPRPASDWQTMTEYYPAPAIYPGNEAQMPDPTIQGNNGVGATPAFRGLIYCVWENMPLATFGNRVPNIRAQVNFTKLFAPPIMPVPNVVQYKNNHGVNGNVTVILDAPPTPGNTLIAIVMYTCDVAASVALPSKFKSIASKAQDAYQTGTIAGTRVVQEGEEGSYVFPVSYPYPANEGGYGDCSCTVIEILGQPTVTATAGVAGTQVAYGNAAADAGNVTLSGPSLGIVGFGAYFNGGVVPGSWSPTAFNSPTEKFSVILANGTIDIIAVAGSAELTGEITASVYDATGATAPITYLTISAMFSDILVANADFAPTLDEVILDLCKRSGLEATDVDVTALQAVEGSPAISAVFPTNIIQGYICERMTTAADVLKELALAYFFGACESDGKIKFIPRTTFKEFTIAENDLGLKADKAKLEEDQTQEQELPLMVTVLYNDVNLNWQQGKQVKQRNARTVTTRQQQLLSLRMSLDDTSARQIAEAALYSAWTNRTAFSTSLLRALYMLLDPTDVVYMEYEGKPVEIRVIQSSMGQGFAVKLRAVAEDVRNFAVTGPNASVVQGVGSQGFKPTQPVAAGPTIIFLLDFPLLRDADANQSGSGFYAVISSISTGWPGAELYQSTDDENFTRLDSMDVLASFGTAVNALGALGPSSPAAPFSPWKWDTENTLTLKLQVGALAGASEAAVLAGANALIVGSELIQFVNAVQNEDGSWTVSQLLRGRRGTDASCYSHMAGETVIMPAAGGLLREAAPLSQIGQERYYRAVTDGADVSAVQDIDLTLAGNDLKPYSPVAVGGSRDEAGNWTICWLRRTRFGGAYGTGAELLIDGMGGPLNEAIEAYEIDILGGSPQVVKRTLSVTTPTAIYTAAQQIADFGEVQATLSVNVYQISDVVGRGSPGAGELPASTDAVPVLPSGGQFYINGS